MRVKLLGWDVANVAGVPLDEQEVIIEPSIEVAEKDKLRARRPPAADDNIGLGDDRTLTLFLNDFHSQHIVSPHRCRERTPPTLG